MNFYQKDGTSQRKKIVVTLMGRADFREFELTNILVKRNIGTNGKKFLWTGIIK